MGVDGSDTPGFRAVMRSSSQRVISPMAICANTAPLKTSRLDLMPGTLMTGTSPPTSKGICTSLCSANCAGVSGLSVPPICTERALICLTPSPDPVGV